MVKRADVLRGQVDAEADVPYEATVLARQAVGARRRLSRIAVAGALGMALAALLTRDFTWVAGALTAALLAPLVAKGRLGALVALALLALLAVLLPVRALFVEGTSTTTFALAAGALVFALACLTDLVLLFRDAELQHAYGRWARRGA